MFAHLSIQFCQINLLILPLKASQSEGNMDTLKQLAEMSRPNLIFTKSIDELAFPTRIRHPSAGHFAGPPGGGMRENEAGLAHILRFVGRSRASTRPITPLHPLSRTFAPYQRYTINAHFAIKSAKNHAF